MNAMTDAELIDILANDGEVAVPYFDDKRVRVHFIEVPVDEAFPVFKRFLTIPAENRRGDARHLHAYCMDVVDMAGDHALEGMGGALPPEEDVWKFARVRSISMTHGSPGSGDAESKIYVIADVAVDWETEHSMSMSWEDGDRLVRVGPFDGAATNYYGPDKPDLGYVYKSCFGYYDTSPDDAQAKSDG